MLVQVSRKQSHRRDVFKATDTVGQGLSKGLTTRQNLLSLFRNLERNAVSAQIYTVF